MTGLISIRRSLVLLGLVLLAACSNERSSDNAISAARTVFGQIRAGGPPPPPSPELVAKVARDALSKTTEAVAIYSLEDRNAVAVLRPVARNGAYTTWASYGSSDRRSATTHHGVLSETRGLGNDLMSSRLSPLLDVVRRRENGVATIRQRYLNGENQIVTIAADCEITRGAAETHEIGGRNVSVVRMDAQCWQAERGVENTYLVDDTGRILQSHHWAGPTMGYSTVRLLRP